MDRVNVVKILSGSILSARGEDVEGHAVLGQGNQRGRLSRGMHGNLEAPEKFVFEEEYLIPEAGLNGDL